jgi:hypothetical protein
MIDMKKAANDNLPLLVRHPRLLAPVQQRECNREQDADRNSKRTNEEIDRELAMIEARIKWLNWMEFAFQKRRTAANDGSQVEPAGRSVTG